LKARRLFIGAGVHFHAVDDGEEIAALQTVEAHCFAQRARYRMLRAPA
jgi:hypothetical protein